MSQTSSQPHKRRGQSTDPIDPVALGMQIRDRMVACYDLCRTNPAEALRITRQAEREAIAAGSLLGRAAAVIYTAEAYKFLGRREDIGKCFAKLATFCDRIELPADRAWALNALGTYHTEQNDLVAALGFLYRAREVREAVGNRLGISHTDNSIGITLHKCGVYEKSLDYLLGALRIREEHGNPMFICSSLTNIGALYGDLQDYQKAMEYQERCLELSRSLGHPEALAFALDNLGITLAYLDRHDEAVPLFKEALAIRRQIGDKAQQARSLSNLAGTLLQLNEPEGALSLYTESLALSEGQQDEYMAVMTLRCIGHTHRRRGESAKAALIYAEVLRRSRLAPNAAEERRVHQDLAHLYAETGDFRTALAHLKQYRALHEEHLGTERREAVAAVEIRHALMEADQQREMLQLRAERAEREAEHNRRELHSLTLKLTHRNEALIKVRDLAAPAARTARGQTKLAASRIIQAIDASAADRSDWNLLEQQFTNVHEGFVAHLRERAPNLTPTETKICLLVKMNCSNKQIADLLFTSILTVKTHRTRIRRKLGLTTGDNLESLLLSF